MKITLDPENEEMVQEAMQRHNRSATSIVNELLSLIKIKYPKKRSIEVELEKEVETDAIGRRKVVSRKVL